MDEIRCWRCDRKLGETTVWPVPDAVPCPAVKLAVESGRIVISCPRCRAPNVVLVLDKAVSMV